MNIRSSIFTLAAIVFGLLADGPLHAQQLKLQVDRDTGTLSLTGVDASAVDFAAYQIDSTRGTLDALSWNGLRDTEPNWAAGPLVDSNYLVEVNTSNDQTSGAVVNDTIQLDLGAAYDPATIVAGLPLGEDVEVDDLSIEYVDQFSGLTLPGVVEFVGEKILNNIGITVDLADGKAYLENESPNNLTITGYLIESNSGTTLNSGAGFTGLGGNFQKAPANPDGADLGELDSTVGGGQLLASSMAPNTLGIDLGVVVDPTPESLFFANGDLSFSFVLSGNGSSRPGFVKFINIPDSPPGDYNENGFVEGSDFLAWQRGESTDPLSATDLVAWQSNYGSGVGSAVATVGTVPEPTTAVLLIIMVMGNMVGARRSGT